jgi:hypothetical protein
LDASDGAHPVATPDVRPELRDEGAEKLAAREPDVQVLDD